MLHGRVLFALNDMHKDAVGVCQVTVKVTGRKTRQDKTREVDDRYLISFRATYVALGGQYSLELSAEHV